MLLCLIERLFFSPKQNVVIPPKLPQDGDSGHGNKVRLNDQRSDSRSQLPPSRSCDRLCLVAKYLGNLWKGLNEIFKKNWQWDKEQMIQWCSRLSSGFRKFQGGEMRNKIKQFDHQKYDDQRIKGLWPLIFKDQGQAAHFPEVAATGWNRKCGEMRCLVEVCALWVLSEVCFWVV